MSICVRKFYLCHKVLQSSCLIAFSCWGSYFTKTSVGNVIKSAFLIISHVDHYQGIGPVKYEHAQFAFLQVNGILPNSNGGGQPDLVESPLFASEISITNIF